MELLFENKTECTDKEYEKYLQIYQKEYAVQERLNTIIYFIFLIFCIIFAINEKQIALGIGLIVIMIIFIWYKFIRPYKLLQKTQKKTTLEQYICHYKFYKNNFTVNAPEGTATIFYFKLYKVIETNTNFYIFISKENGFILSKEGFTKGKTKEFSNFISKKTMLKYKNRIEKIN